MLFVISLTVLALIEKSGAEEHLHARDAVQRPVCFYFILALGAWTNVNGGSVACMLHSNIRCYELLIPGETLEQRRGCLQGGPCQQEKNDNKKQGCILRKQVNAACVFCPGRKLRWLVVLGQLVIGSECHVGYTKRQVEVLFVAGKRRRPAVSVGRSTR